MLSLEREIRLEKLPCCLRTPKSRTSWSTHLRGASLSSWRQPRKHCTSEKAALKIGADKQSIALAKESSNARPAAITTWGQGVGLAAVPIFRNGTASQFRIRKSLGQRTLYLSPCTCLSRVWVSKYACHGVTCPSTQVCQSSLPISESHCTMSKLFYPSLISPQARVVSLSPLSYWKLECQSSDLLVHGFRGVRGSHQSFFRFWSHPLLVCGTNMICTLALLARLIQPSPCQAPTQQITFGPDCALRSTSSSRVFTLESAFLMPG